MYYSRSNHWARLPALPEPLLGGGAALLGGRLHFVGGALFRDGMYLRDSAQHYVLSLSEGHHHEEGHSGWQRLPGLSYARNHMALVEHGGRLFAFGGQLLNEEACMNQPTLEAYDPAQDRWETLAAMPAGRGHITPSSLSTPHGIVVAGGVVDKPRSGKAPCKTPGIEASAGLLYDFGKNRWSSLPGAPCGLLILPRGRPTCLSACPLSCPPGLDDSVKQNPMFWGFPAF